MDVLFLLLHPFCKGFVNYDPVLFIKTWKSKINMVLNRRIKNRFFSIIFRPKIVFLDTAQILDLARPYSECSRDAKRLLRKIRHTFTTTAYSSKCVTNFL